MNNPEDMAARVAQLEQLVAQLTQQNANLQQQVATINQAQAQVPPAGPANIVQANQPVRFAVTPGLHEVDQLIDYSKKQGTTLYEQGTRALTNEFDMKPDSTVIFIQSFKTRCKEMGWSEGAMNITKFVNSAGLTIDLVEQYGQIDSATLKTQCDDFARQGGPKFESRAAQNNHMMSICLNNTLTADAKSRLLPYRAEYNFDGIDYAPLMFKTIMRLATIDSVATTEALRANLRELPAYTATVKGDIDKMHSYFDENYSQLIARGATIDNPVGILFDAYRVVPCSHFQGYIIRKHEEYLDGELEGLTHEKLMAMATDKFTYLQNKGLWGTKTAEEKLVAMAAEIEQLKGQLKLAPKLQAAVDDKKKKWNKKDKDKAKILKNKKKKGDKKFQKADEEWKKKAPKDGEPTQKEHNGYTYHWCVHHMAWTMHSPAKCRKNPAYKPPADEKSTAAQATADVASAATTINPAYATILSNMARCAADE